MESNHEFAPNERFVMHKQATRAALDETGKTRAQKQPCLKRCAYITNPNAIPNWETIGFLDIQNAHNQEYVFLNQKTLPFKFLKPIFFYKTKNRSLPERFFTFSKKKKKGRTLDAF